MIVTYTLSHIISFLDLHTLHPVYLKVLPLLILNKRT